MRQKGFALIVILLVLVLVSALGYVVYIKGYFNGYITKKSIISNTSKPTAIKSSSSPLSKPIIYDITQHRNLIISLDILIQSDDTVTEYLPIEIKEGRKSYFKQPQGDYEVRIMDSKKDSTKLNIIWSYQFPVYFDYSGPVVEGVDYSDIKYKQVSVGMAIPYDLRMKSIQIWHKDKLIFSKDLPQPIL